MVRTDRTERSGEKFSLIIAATSSSEGFWWIAL
jgi:hypothetical protein